MNPDELYEEIVGYPPSDKPDTSSQGDSSQPQGQQTGTESPEDIYKQITGHPIVQKIADEKNPEQSKAAGQAFLGQAADLVEKFGGFLGNVGIGAGKGVAETVKGMSSLGEKYLTRPLGKALSSVGVPGFEEFKDTQGKPTAAEQFVPKKLTEPEGGSQKLGYYAEKIGEFLVPSGKVAALEKGIPLLGKAATEAGVVGGTTALQKGEFDDEVKRNAIIGSLFPVGGAALKEAGKGIAGGVGAVGEKIYMSKIKPSIHDMKDGFKVENIQKYGVGGNLAEILSKTESKMRNLSGQVKEKLKSSPATINIDDVYSRTAKALDIGKAKQFGDIQSNERILKELKDEITQATNGKPVDLLTAQDIKIGAGRKGAWVYGMADKDSRSTEKVYTAFYQELKKEIENKSPEGIKGLNKQLSDLIPIQNAVIRRMPIEERNNAISLTDTIGLYSALFDPKSLALMGINKLSKSGKFANVLMKASEGMKGEPKSAVGQRIFGGDIKNQPMGMSIKDVSKETLHPEDNSRIIQFIDSVRLRKGENIQLEIDARRLAERYGINPDVPNNKLANKLQELIEKMKKK